MIRQAGFAQAEMVQYTGFKSSPYTEGALFGAIKPGLAQGRGAAMTSPDALKTYQEFVNQAYAPGALDPKTKRLIALGASLAAGCDP